MPETITTFELEHSHDLTDELRLTVAGYHNRISNLVTLETDERPAPGAATRRAPCSASSSQNSAGETLAWGAEAGLHWQPGRFLLVDLSYSYVTLRNASDEVKAATPAHLASGRLLVPLGNGEVRLATQATYQSARDSGEDGAASGEALLLGVGLSGEFSALPLLRGRAEPAGRAVHAAGERGDLRRARAPVRPHLHPAAHGPPTLNERLDGGPRRGARGDRCPGARGVPRRLLAGHGVLVRAPPSGGRRPRRRVARPARAAACRTPTSALFSMPGGGAHSGESHVQTGLRELREEVGLTLSAASLRAAVRRGGPGGVQARPRLLPGAGGGRRARADHRPPRGGVGRLHRRGRRAPAPAVLPVRSYLAPRPRGGSPTTELARPLPGGAGAALPRAAPARPRRARGHRPSRAPPLAGRACRARLRLFTRGAHAAASSNGRHSALQGRGLGARLVATGGGAQRRGFTHAHLHARPRRPFYERLGYAVYGEPYRGEHPHRHMRKTLASSILAEEEQEA